LELPAAFAEEAMFRGYLILRLRATTRNLLTAIILSTAIFSFGHGYEGSAGVVAVGFVGLVFALVYVWRKSLSWNSGPGVVYRRGAQAPDGPSGPG
jgi:membrane protease YdiL (CAAX protease family)